MIDVLGYGGVGDCFIIILKLLEFRKTNPEFLYHHVENDKARLNICSELLHRFNIPHRLIHVPDVKEWWEEHANEYDFKFNMFAKGYIDVPFKPYHWEPFQDEGVAWPYSGNEPENDWVIIQVNAGSVASARPFRLRVLRRLLKTRNYESSRHILNKSILSYLKQTGLIEKRILWVGTDRCFREPFGENTCGRMSFNKTLDLIASCRTFVGLNSVLLYWALYNGVSCHLFMNYQGRTDQRIHELWKTHLVYLQ